MCKTGIVFILFSILLHCAAHARTTIRILEKTKSGKTLIINRGTLEGVQSNDFGIITQENSKVAQGYAVKVYNNFSLWYVTKFFNKDLLQEGEAYNLVPASVINDHELKQRKQVTHAGKKKFRLAKIEKDYEQDKFFGDVVEEKEKADLVSQTDGQWVEGSEGKLFAVENEKDKKSNLKQIDSREQYEGIVSSHLKKRDEQLDNEEFYSEQKRDKAVGIFREKPSKDVNLYKKLLKQLELRRHERGMVLERLEKEIGLDWSDDLSDDDLTDFLRSRGIVSEQMRQISSLSSAARAQITLSTGTSFHDDKGLRSSNSSTFSYDLGVNAEFFLASWFRQLSFLGIEGSYRRGYDKIFIESTDGDINESSWMVAFNFYPFANPTALRANIFLLGVGHRQGTAVLSYGGRSVDMQMTITPTIYAGLRYNLYSGWGFRILGLYEPTSMISTTMGTDNVKYANYKMNIGLSYIF